MKKLLLILAALSLFISCKEEVASETEPNDTFLTANAISMNETYNADITLEDVDHFSFTVPTGEIYRITLEWISGDLDLYTGAAIYDSGSWIIQGYIDNTDEAGDETFTIANSTSTDQEWCVGVLDYWDTGTGSYTITLTDDGSAAGSAGVSITNEIAPEVSVNAITAPEGNTK